MKEIHWKLIAQCFAGTLCGMIGGIIGFMAGLAVGEYILNNYEIGPVYGGIIGIISGSIIGITIFRKMKRWKNYKNFSLTAIIVILSILLPLFINILMGTGDEGLLFMVGIMAYAFSLFIGFSLIPSIIITIGTYFFEKNHKSP